MSEAIRISSKIFKIWRFHNFFFFCRVSEVFKTIFESFIENKRQVVSSSTGQIVEVESEVLTYAIEHVMSQVAEVIYY